MVKGKHNQPLGSNGTVRKAHACNIQVPFGPNCKGSWPRVDLMRILTAFRPWKKPRYEWILSTQEYVDLVQSSMKSWLFLFFPSIRPLKLSCNLFHVLPFQLLWVHRQLHKTSTGSIHSDHYTYNISSSFHILHHGRQPNSLNPSRFIPYSSSLLQSSHWGHLSTSTPVILPYVQPQLDISEGLFNASSLPTHSSQGVSMGWKIPLNKTTRHIIQARRASLVRILRQECFRHHHLLSLETAYMIMRTYVARNEYGNKYTLWHLGQCYLGFLSRLQQRGKEWQIHTKIDFCHRGNGWRHWRRKV